MPNVTTVLTTIEKINSDKDFFTISNMFNEMSKMGPGALELASQWANLLGLVKHPDHEALPDALRKTADLIEQMATQPEIEKPTVEA